MSTKTEAHALLADYSYSQDERKLPDIYEVKKVIETSTGYRGIIARNKVTGDYVVAHTGTEFDIDKGRDVFLTDAQMALLKVNQQLDDARDTVRLAMEYARKDGTQLTQTGHSLGGFFVEVNAHELGVPGETYNGYGAAGLYGVPETASPLVINHVRVTDAVAAANGHFGEVRLYATQKDQDILLNNTSLPGEQGTRELLGDLKALNPDVTHGMIQFHDSGRKLEELATYGPDSIIRERNQDLYRERQGEFDAYRESIRQHAHGASTLFKNSIFGNAYSTVIGAEYLRHKVRHHLAGNEVHDEIRGLQNEARQAVDERNRTFIPPAGPLIYRDNASTPYLHPERDPQQHFRDRLDQQLRSLDDDRCREPGARTPLSLRDDPLGYVNRMVAAYDNGDMDTFRGMIREAAQDPFARQMQAQATEQVDREEFQARQLQAQAAEQSQREQQQHVMLRQL